MHAPAKCRIKPSLQAEIVALILVRASRRFSHSPIASLLAAVTNCRPVLHPATSTVTPVSSSKTPLYIAPVACASCDGINDTVNIHNIPNKNNAIRRAGTIISTVTFITLHLFYKNNSIKIALSRFGGNYNTNPPNPNHIPPKIQLSQLSHVPNSSTF